jgi:hypothetical protein
MMNIDRVYRTDVYELAEMAKVMVPARRSDGHRFLITVRNEFIDANPSTVDLLGETIKSVADYATDIGEGTRWCAFNDLNGWREFKGTHFPATAPVNIADVVLRRIAERLCLALWGVK